MVAIPQGSAYLARWRRQRPQARADQCRIVFSLDGSEHEDVGNLHTDLDGWYK